MHAEPAAEKRGFALVVAALIAGACVICCFVTDQQFLMGDARVANSDCERPGTGSGRSFAARLLGPLDYSEVLALMVVLGIMGYISGVRRYR